MPSSQHPKILYLITLSELGGAQKYVFDLAIYSRDQGFNVAVGVGGDPTGQLLSVLSRSNIQTFYLRHLGRSLNFTRDFLLFFDLLKLIRQVKPDILHLNSSKIGALGALAGRLAGVKKIVYTVHGLILNEPLSLPSRIFYWLAEWFSAFLKNDLICVSDFDRQSLLKNKICSARKISVIHNGLDPETLTLYPRPAAREKLSSFSVQPLFSSDFLVGCLANFYPTKGLAYLVEAASEVVKIHDQVKFVLIGDGPLAPALRQSIHNYHLTDRIILTGALPGASQYLSAFDLFVLPSLKEGLPYALLEASAAGLPIVTTTVGGNPEVVINDFNGLLVPPADITALAETLINLIPDQSRLARYATNSQAKIKEFSLSQMCEQTIQVYLS